MQVMMPLDQIVDLFETLDSAPAVVLALFQAAIPDEDMLDTIERRPCINRKTDECLVELFRSYHGSVGVRFWREHGFVGCDSGCLPLPDWTIHVRLETMVLQT